MNEERQAIQHDNGINCEGEVSWLKMKNNELQAEIHKLRCELNQANIDNKAVTINIYTKSDVEDIITDIFNKLKTKGIKYFE